MIYSCMLALSLAASLFKLFSLPATQLLTAFITEDLNAMAASYVGSDFPCAESLWLNKITKGQNMF